MNKAIRICFNHEFMYRSSYKGYLRLSLFFILRKAEVLLPRNTPCSVRKSCTFLRFVLLAYSNPSWVRIAIRKCNLADDIKSAAVYLRIPEPSSRQCRLRLLAVILMVKGTQSTYLISQASFKDEENRSGLHSASPNPTTVHGGFILKWKYTLNYTPDAKHRWPECNLVLFCSG